MANGTSSPPYITSFGPTAAGKFDFTLLFEDTILNILPSGIFLLLLPCRIFFLKSERAKVSQSSLQEFKRLFLVVYAVLQLAILVLWAVSSSPKSRATLVAAGLDFVVALGLCVLSQLEHIRSIRPSSLLNVYLLLTLLFDIARCRTIWLDENSIAISTLFTSTLGVKILVLLAEGTEKRDILLNPYQHLNPESTSGIYSRSMFWWLNALMHTGYRRVLANEDMYPTEESMTSANIERDMYRNWTIVKDKSRSRALFWSVLWTLKVPFTLSVFPRLILMAFKYAQPFLISRAVGFADDLDESNNIGWGLTGAFGLVLVGQAISTGAYWHMTYRFLVYVRGALVGLIYGKTLDVSVTALDESIAVTLMATDTETVCLAFENIHELWAAPLEAAIAFYLLHLQLGLAFIGPAIVVIVSIAGILVVAQFTGNAQKRWIEGIQTRVDATAKMLSSMKSVKMLGLTDLLNTGIQNFRISELVLSRKFRKLLCIRVLFANSTGVLAPLVTFIVFVVAAGPGGQRLNASIAYTGLSLIELLQGPINTFIRAVPEMNSAFACLGRIQKFLLSDARKDHRLSMERSTDRAPMTANEQGIELDTFARRLDDSESSDMIVLKNASFGWDDNAPPIVTDVNLTIQRAQATFIIGPVGSGKSTLLKGLLGEVSNSKGFVYTRDKQAAYVDQTPWIQNQSVRRNILGISTFDEKWYNSVIFACGLEQDLSIFPKGDRTRVGSGGISLSGGQRQRVALARAVYSRKPLVILDDVFSGIDATTEEHIFKHVLGRQGLFKQHEITVILVTHAVQRLPYANHIIALDSSGRVCEHGSFDELKSAGGYVQRLATKHKAENVENDKQAKVSQATALTIAGPEPVTVDEPTELTRQTGELAVYAYYFRTVAAYSWSFFIGLCFAYALGSKMTQLLLTYWTSAIKSHGPEVDDFYLGMYTMISISGLAALMGAVLHFLLNIVPKTAERLHARLLRTVVNAPLSFFSTTDMGKTLNRFSQDMNVVDIELPFSLVDFVFNAFSVLISAALMCVSTSYFAATIPVVFLMLWVLQKFYLSTSRQIRILDLEAKSPLYTHFVESLSGLSTIRAFGWATDFQDQSCTLLDASQRPYYLLFCIQRWLALILDMMVAGLAIVLMVLIVTLREKIGGAYAGLALVNVMSFNEFLAQLIKTWTSVETSIGAIARLKDFERNTASEHLPKEVEATPENWPLHGAIEFRHVSASYLPESALVLSDLNLKIRPGEKIGICGRSGSGKSSLVIALSRMLELSPESLLMIDGVDITTLPRQYVRQCITAIPQEPFFMISTIRQNADPSRDHTDEEIITALKKVQLWELIREKGGLDEALDQDIFSHGQRQLFSLARAILRKSKIVVLDEATSSVDAESDALMQRIIRQEFADCTILAVAHRLDTILDFDRIALLSEGRLVECDPPKTLLSRDRGNFRRDLARTTD